MKYVFLPSELSTKTADCLLSVRVESCNNSLNMFIVLLLLLFPGKYFFLVIFRVRIVYSARFPN